MRLFLLKRKSKAKTLRLGGGFPGMVSKSGLQGFVWPVWGRGGGSWRARNPEELFLPSWLHDFMACEHVDPVLSVSLVGDTPKPRSA